MVSTPSHHIWLSACTLMPLVCGCHYHGRYMRMTDAELIAELARPENRMPNTWRDDTATFEISENGCGGYAGAMVDFGGSVPSALAYALNDDYSRVLDRPTVLAPLLTAHDPEILLTTLYIYQRLFSSSFNRERSWDRREIEIVAYTIRQMPMRHVDTRVRWMSLSVLRQLQCITADDLAAALADRSLAVRHEALTTFSSWRQANSQTFYPPGTEVLNETAADGRTRRTTIRGPTYDICVLDRRSRELIVPVLIDRLEDSHPWVRQRAWDQLTPLVSWVEPRSVTGTQPADETPDSGYQVVMPLPRPKGSDWRWLVQESWQTRHAAVEQIRATWKERSHAILQQTQACREMVEAASGSGPRVTSAGLPRD